MDIALIITTLTTLFVVIDPIGTTPVFIALTRGMSARLKRAIALRACLVAAAILSLFASLTRRFWALSGSPCPPSASRAGFCCS